MRLNAQTGAMEGGFVHLPREAHWLADYLHELMTFPRGRYDDQVDSTAQALAWSKQSQSTGIIEYYRMLCERNKHPEQKMVKLRAPAGVTSVPARPPTDSRELFICDLYEAARFRISKSFFSRLFGGSGWGIVQR
jgi:hypothetical protein